MIAPYRLLFKDLFSLELERHNGKKVVDVCDVKVCLASATSQNEDALEFRQLELSKKLCEKFRSKIQDFLVTYSKIWANGGQVIYPYQGDSRPREHEVEYLYVNDYQFIKEQIKPIMAYQDMLSFQSDEKTFVDTMRFYVIVVTPLNMPQEMVYFYRFYNRKQVISQSRFFAAMWRGTNEFDLIDENALIFDDTIDCISRGDNLFILKKDHFHSIFHFLEELEKSVDSAVTSIHTQLTQIQVAVDGYDDFVNDCKKNRLKMAMLNNIAKKPYLKDLTPAKIQRVVDRLDKNLVGEEFLRAFTKEQKLLYDAKRPWVLLKLLGDSYLWSDMTEIGYDVNAKREL